MSNFDETNFSERMGIQNHPIQTTDLDSRSKIRIQNFLLSLPSRSSVIKGVDYINLSRTLWEDFFAGDKIQFNGLINKAKLEIKESAQFAFSPAHRNSDIQDRVFQSTILNILRSAAWNEYFDLLEYIFNWLAKLRLDVHWLCEQINTELTKENVGYQAVFSTNDKKAYFHPMAGEYNQKIFTSLANSDIQGVRNHLGNASKLFKAQDFHGSSSEAVKALEASLIEIGGGNTGGDAIKNIRKKFPQPMLIDIAEKVYAFRNHALGHGKPSSIEITEEEALFILGVSSSVIYFLQATYKSKSN